MKHPIYLTKFDCCVYDIKGDFYLDDKNPILIVLN